MPDLCPHRIAVAAMLAHRLGRAHHGRRVTRHTALACWRGRQADQQVTRRASHETMKTAPTEVVEHLSRGLTHSSDLSREGLA